MSAVVFTPSQVIAFLAICLSRPMRIYYIFDIFSENYSVSRKNTVSSLLMIKCIAVSSLSRASSPLAQLYSTSTMEHHHFDQCLMILSSQGNQVLSNLSPEEYSRVVKVLEDAILSTDLAVYFRKRGAFLTLARSGGYNWAYTDHRELLRGMLMTVCDLAAITKPWEVEKRVAELVSSEFFEQGDIERRTLNITPIVSN